MKILLTNLPTQFQVADDYTPRYVIDKFSAYPPLGLLYIAAGVDQRHNLEVLDAIIANFTIDQTIEYICEKKPDLLGISVVTHRLYPMYAITRRIKKILPEIKIAAGGPHVNIYPVETLNLGTVDYVLRGDAERTFPLLVEAIDSKREDRLESVPNLYFRSLKDNRVRITRLVDDEINMDSLPFPRRDLLDMSKYYTLADKVKMTTINSSRGCPYRCIFCDIQSKRYRYRSALNIADEMEKIVSSGISEIHIFDDTFNVKRERVIALCNEIIKRKLSINWSARSRVQPLDEQMLSLMKQSGCYRLHLGVESGNPEVLKMCGKGITVEQIKETFRLCRKYKIEALSYFIIGFPGESKTDILKTLDFIKSIRPSYILVTSLYPLPNTRFYAELLYRKVFNKDYWFEFVTRPAAGFKLPLWRKAKEEKEVQEMLDYIYRNFYISWQFIITQIKDTKSLTLLLLKVKLGCILIKNWLWKRASAL